MLASLRKLSSLLAFAGYGAFHPRCSLIAYQAIYQHGAIQKPLELTRLIGFLRNSPVNRVLEVGSRRGGSLFALSRIASRDATLVSVDFHPKVDPNSARRQLESVVLPTQSLHCVWGDSHAASTLAQVQNVMEGVQFDLIFLDGDHSFDGISEDYQTYAPLLRPGGVAVFHDIVENPEKPAYGVARFWREQQPQGLDMLEFVDRFHPAPGMGLGIMKNHEKRVR